MSACYDWSSVGGDPASVDTAAVRAAADAIDGKAAIARRNAEDLSAKAVTAQRMEWEGIASTAFRGEFEQHPWFANELADKADTASLALRAFARVADEYANEAITQLQIAIQAQADADRGINFNDAAKRFCDAHRTISEVRADYAILVAQTVAKIEDAALIAVIASGPSVIPHYEQYGVSPFIVGGDGDLPDGTEFVNEFTKSLMSAVTDYGDIWSTFWADPEGTIEGVIDNGIKSLNPLHTIGNYLSDLGETVDEHGYAGAAGSVGGDLLLLALPGVGAVRGASRVAKGAKHADLPHTKAAGEVASRLEEAAKEEADERKKSVGNPVSR